MLDQNKNSLISRDEVESKLINILEDMTSDWELDFEGGITPERRLMEDLAFESLDVVQLVVALEKAFDKKGMPFEKLFMREGDYVDEIQVKEVSDFLYENLSKS